MFKRKFTLIITFSFVFIVNTFAQNTWEKTYGGPNLDEGRSVLQTTDGGYIVSGFTTSYGAGDYDYYLVKTNSYGDTLWTKTYGTNRDDRAGCIIQTADGGYIISGFSLPVNDTLGDIYFIKLNAQGDTIWSKRYEGANDHRGYLIQKTEDGGFIISGSTYSYGASYLDILLMKTDSLGDTLWIKTYGGDGIEQGFAVQTSDYGYILSGYTTSFGDTLGDIYLIKTNSQGDTLWTKTYGGDSAEEGFAFPTTDGGYIVSGYTSSYGAGGIDIYLIKTDSLGDTLWTKTYGGSNNERGAALPVSDGGYFIIGSTESFGAVNGDIYLIKTDASGNPLWTKTYGGTGIDYGVTGQQTSDGGYIISGITNSFGAGGYDIYLIKTNSSGNVAVEEEIIAPNTSATDFFVESNPFIFFTSIPGHENEFFEVKDIVGRSVGIYKGDKIGENLLPGIYFLSLSNTNIQGLRIIKIK